MYDCVHIQSEDEFLMCLHVVCWRLHLNISCSPFSAALFITRFNRGMLLRLKTLLPYLKKKLLQAWCALPDSVLAPTLRFIA